MEKEKLLVLVVLFAVLFIGGGWYLLNYKNTNQSNNISSTESTATSPTNDQNTNNNSEKNGNTYSMDEVKTHNSSTDCWLIINNNVYNVTSFIPKHPGGKDIIKGCGKDATSLFNNEDEHQEKNAASYLPDYLIGTLNK